MAEPYLSLVVTARNDDHGGNLLGRMQAFVNGWLNQARAHGLDSELIIVEWNPPADRPRLAEALRWPADFGPCTVRIIEVSPELHSRYPHGRVLPLYQMIGKNVGIRRARGRFVLATNIDILFSSELVAFLAARQLREDRMYRIDRYDAMGDVPVDASPEEQLEYCRTHLLRVNRRGGTFRVSTDGEPVLAPIDVATSESGFQFGEGWYSEERYGTREVFRWAAGQAELTVHPPSGAGTLVLDVEPGPGVVPWPLELTILAEEKPFARVTIPRRSDMRIRADWSTVRHIGFVYDGQSVPLLRDPRTLIFRVFRADWENGENRSVRAGVEVQPISVARWAGSIRLAAQDVIAKLVNGGPVVDLTVPVPPWMKRMLRPFSGKLLPAKEPAQPAAKEEQQPASGPASEVVAPAPLHTNACGDFTLAALERWCDLRGYAEFDLYSMNLDSVFCYAAHHGGAEEEVLTDPMRIYHIEHGSGSGWTPEGQAKLFQRIAALGLSWVDNDTLLTWGGQMRRFNSPMVFNRENWGFGDCVLPETVLRASRFPS
jgi:hypothetical protein